MAFDAIRFPTEAETYAFHGTCKVNPTFNFRLSSKNTILTSFISCEIAQGLLESLGAVVQVWLNK